MIGRLLWDLGRTFGPRRLAWRAWYEGANRSGLRAWLDGQQRAPILTRPPTYAAWMGALPPHHWLARVHRWVGSGAASEAMRGLLDDEAQAALLARAADAAEGRVVLFGGERVEAGWPIDWHLSPRPGQRWPQDWHPSRLAEAESWCGDVRWTWELGRFAFAYDWARAYALEPSARWVEAFAASVASWEEANPYGAGVHWASGQELAVRALTWIWALVVLGGDEAWREEDHERLLRLLELHATHIEAHIEFARQATPNNHLLGEALALYVIGSVFDYIRPATRWRQLGRDILIDETPAQWATDGGYIQSSHNYHRLALHYMLWAWHIARAQGDEAWRGWTHLFEVSGAYLAAMQDHETGYLPNLGELDSALLCPWTSCDPRDMRPLLQTLRWITNHTRAYEPGPWDEALLWCSGPDAVDGDAEVLSWPNPSRKSFAASGLHVLRTSPEQLAVMRCGGDDEVPFGQSDQLHVDLWWRGVNVALDPGSYIYNDALHVHAWMSGTAGHNTVTVEGADQRLRLRRFMWVGATRARCTWRGDALDGEHEGYVGRFGVQHERSLWAWPGRWRVEDRLSAPRWSTRLLTLHWLLVDGDWTLEPLDADGTAWQLERPDAGDGLALRVTVQVVGDHLVEVEPLELRRAVDEGPERVGGWSSTRYNRRDPALSVVWPVRARGALRFWTMIECISS